MSTTSRYFKKLRDLQLKICIEWLASRLWLSTLKQFWVRTEVKLSTLLQRDLGIAGWEPGTSGLSPDLGMAIRFLTRAGEGTCRGTSWGHRLRGMEDEPWDLCQLCFMRPFLFFVWFLLSYLFLFTFCLLRAWLNQPRLHLLQRCCEPVTDETAKSNALNSPVLLQVCQIL